MQNYYFFRKQESLSPNNFVLSAIYRNFAAEIIVQEQGVTVNENSPLDMSAENMDTYTYWLQGFIYYDDATLAEKSKTYRKSVIHF